MSQTDKEECHPDFRQVENSVGVVEFGAKDMKSLSSDVVPFSEKLDLILEALAEFREVFESRFSAIEDKISRIENSLCVAEYCARDVKFLVNDAISSAEECDGSLDRSEEELTKLGVAVTESGEALSKRGEALRNVEEKLTHNHQNMMMDARLEPLDLSPSGQFGRLYYRSSYLSRYRPWGYALNDRGQRVLIVASGVQIPQPPFNKPPSAGRVRGPRGSRVKVGYTG